MKDNMNAGEITEYMIGTPWKTDHTDPRKGGFIHTEDGAFVGHFGAGRPIVDHVIEVHNASLPSAAEPHAFVPQPGYESLCQVCDDDEGGDLHQSEALELYFVSAGDSLAEAIRGFVFTDVQTAREYARHELTADDDEVDNFVFVLPVTAQAFDLERLADRD